MKRRGFLASLFALPAAVAAAAKEAPTVHPAVKALEESLEKETFIQDFASGNITAIGGESVGAINAGYRP